MITGCRFWNMLEEGLVRMIAALSDRGWTCHFNVLRQWTTRVEPMPNLCQNGSDL